MCFAIHWGNDNQRLDTASNNPLLKELLGRLSTSQFGAKPLGSFLNDEKGIRYGTGTPPPSRPKSNDSVPFIRATDIKNGKILCDTLVYIDKTQPKHMQKCLLSAGEVIIVRSGVNTGDCAVVPDSLAGSYAAYDLILQLHHGKGMLLPEFLTAFLDTNVGRNQMNVLKGRSAQPHLNAEEIRSLMVPSPKLSNQEKLLDKLYKARELCAQKNKQASDLLSELSKLVLDILGISIPKVNDRKTTYAVLASEVHNEGRLIPDYFHPERLHAIRAVSRAYRGDNCATLSSIVSFERDLKRVSIDDNYLGLANVQSNTGERVNDTRENITGNAYRYTVNDVLFARLRPYLNKVYLAESPGVCSTEFHVMRVKGNPDGDPEVKPDYLATLLRSELVLSQTRHMMTGNTHPRLANDDVINLVVPIPRRDIQQRIVDEVRMRRNRARLLRDEAEVLWSSAMQDFEDALLGQARRNPA